MKGNRSRLFFSSSALVLSSFFLMGIGSCSHTQITAMCKERLPTFKSDIDGAVASLTFPGQSPGGASRILAGEGDRVQSTPLEKGDRDYWTKWSRTKLKETQNYLDLIEDEPKNRPLRREIGQIANEFVVLHGLALAGKREQILKKLSEIKERTLKIEQTSCSL